MWRLIRVLPFICCAFIFIPLLFVQADLVCATWNLKWFPSHFSDKKAPAAVEKEQIEIAAKILTQGLEQLHGDDVLLFFQEMRDQNSCDALIGRLPVRGLHPVEVSAFRDSYGIVIWQQLCIATTLPVLERGSIPWSPSPGGALPRGFSYAVLRLRDHAHLIAICLHLKSNRSLGGGVVEEQRNIYKREKSSEQILRKINALCDRYGEDSKIVIAGDFNTDEDNDRFVSEATLRSFYGAHFRNCLTGIPPEKRVTIPASGGYQDATFDYILYKGLEKKTKPFILDGTSVSDHNLVLFLLQTGPSPK